jgi:hypothetical protein
MNRSLSVTTTLLVPLMLGMLCGPLERLSLGLECNSSCPAGVIDRGAQLVPASGTDLPGGHTMSPGICGTPANGFVAVSVDTSNQYRVLQFNGAGIGRGPTWDVWDSGYTWKSKPTCAQTDQSIANGQPGFVVIGLGSDNTLHAAAGAMAPFDPYVQQNPSQIMVDEQIDTRTYLAGPGAASVLFPAPDGLIMVVVMDSHQTMYAYSKQFPYLWDAWSAPQQLATLPYGWIPVGPPAIDNGTGGNGLNWGVAVHARNVASRQERMFWTWFSTNSYGMVTFAARWTQLGGTISGTISDAPSLTWDNQLSAETLFYRSGSQIVQTSSTSASPFGTLPLLSGASPVWPGIASAPAAARGAYDEGEYVVLARGTDNRIYVGEAAPEAQLMP